MKINLNDSVKVKLTDWGKENINEIDGAVVYAAVQNTVKKVIDMCMLKEEKQNANT